MALAFYIQLAFPRSRLFFLYISVEVPSIIKFKLHLNFFFLL